MAIEYTYEIKAVGPESIEVEYKANGHQTMRLGLPRPYVGDDLVAIIDQYAPILQWEDAKRTRMDVQVGLRSAKAVARLTRAEALAAWEAQQAPAEPTKEQVFEVGKTNVVVADV